MVTGIKFMAVFVMVTGIKFMAVFVMRRDAACS